MSEMPGISEHAQKPVVSDELTVLLLKQTLTAQ
jgi:hypothetical protein